MNGQASRERERWESFHLSQWERSFMNAAFSFRHTSRSPPKVARTPRKFADYRMTQRSLRSSMAAARRRNSQTLASHDISIAVVPYSAALLR